MANLFQSITGLSSIDVVKVVKKEKNPKRMTIEEVRPLIEAAVFLHQTSAVITDPMVPKQKKELEKQGFTFARKEGRWVISWPRNNPTPPDWSFEEFLRKLQAQNLCLHLKYDLVHKSYPQYADQFDQILTHEYIVSNDENFLSTDSPYHRCGYYYSRYPSLARKYAQQFAPVDLIAGDLFIPHFPYLQRSELVDEIMILYSTLTPRDSLFYSLLSQDVRGVECELMKKMFEKHNLTGSDEFAATLTETPEKRRILLRANNNALLPLNDRLLHHLMSHQMYPHNIHELGRQCDLLKKFGETSLADEFMVYLNRYQRKYTAIEADNQFFDTILMLVEMVPLYIEGRQSELETWRAQIATRRRFSGFVIGSTFGNCTPGIPGGHFKVLDLIDSIRNGTFTQSDD